MKGWQGREERGEREESKAGMDIDRHTQKKNLKNCNTDYEHFSVTLIPFGVVFSISPKFLQCARLIIAKK